VSAEQAAPEARNASILTTSVRHVVSLGVDMFADDLESQQVPVIRVDWRPPAATAEQAHRLLGDLED
jgi:hypothetical protein